MLSDAQIHLVQTSFAKIIPRANAVVAMFYDRLFEISPEARALFSEDMSEQRGKLVTTLATVVQSLHSFEDVLPAVRDMGARHVGYNVTDDQYGPVGEALLWTLEQGLGSDWTDDVKQAWQQAYSALACEMIAGANSKSAVA